MRECYVYILASLSGTLYIGMTNDLERRIREHKPNLVPGFTAKYDVDRLVWYESFPDAAQAIAAGKKLKGWTRAKKIALITEKNARWEHLARDWVSPDRDTPRGPSLRSG